MTRLSTASCAMIMTVLLPIGVAHGATALVKYKNCAALQKAYSYGVAKSASAAKSASGLTGKPFISAALYSANASKDRDHDGVACEK